MTFFGPALEETLFEVQEFFGQNTFTVTMNRETRDQFPRHQARLIKSEVTDFNICMQGL